MVVIGWLLPTAESSTSATPRRTGLWRGAMPISATSSRWQLRRTARVIGWLLPTAESSTSATPSLTGPAKVAPCAHTGPVLWALLSLLMARVIGWLLPTAESSTSATPRRTGLWRGAMPISATSSRWQLRRTARVIGWLLPTAESSTSATPSLTGPAKVAPCAHTGPVLWALLSLLMARVIGWRVLMLQ